MRLPTDAPRDYLHHEFETHAGDLIDVTIDAPANVQLLDQANFEKYRERRQFRHQVGGYTQPPGVRLRPPHPGKWHLLIDLGGGPGRVQAFASVIPEACQVFDGS